MLKHLRPCLVAMMGLMILVAGARAQSPGQIFKSPVKNFTIPVPDFPFGTKVVKQSDKSGGGLVLFWGKGGESQRINTSRFTTIAPSQRIPPSDMRTSICCSAPFSKSTRRRPWPNVTRFSTGS